MSEFKGVYFGNYPPGTNFDDPTAPWNQDEPDYKEMPKEELLDWLYNALREDGFEPVYKKGMQIRVCGYDLKLEEP